MSDLEEQFALQLAALGVPEPVREYRFAPPRRWPADFAWPDVWLLVEIEGGTWSRGRHVRGAGYARDVEKYNAAVMAGWRVLRYTGDHVRSGHAAREVAEVLARKGAENAPERATE